MPENLGPDHGRGAVWAVGALAGCCTVHALLLTGGLAGIGAALGAATGTTTMLAAGLVLTAATGVVIARAGAALNTPTAHQVLEETSDHEPQR